MQPSEPLPRLGESVTVVDHVVDASEMRRVLGHFASGVTIVTGMDAGEPVGFACQSFTSVSLTPPLVLFCPAHTSSTWPRIRKAGSFSVNVLAEDQTDLCLRFATSGADKFGGLDWHETAWRVMAPAESTDLKLISRYEPGTRRAQGEIEITYVRIARTNAESAAYSVKGAFFTLMPEVGVDLRGFRISLAHSLLFGSGKSAATSVKKRG